jgi:T5SS/PEP-CTERM-associated repeat protein
MVRSLLFAGGGALLAIPGAARGDSTGNLLVNPGAEQGATTGWTISQGALGRFSSASNGGYGPRSGTYYFYGGGSEYSTAYQSIYLPSHLSLNAIDNGEARLDVSWWNRSYLDASPIFWWDVGTNDTSEVYVQFYNASGQYMSTAYNGGEHKQEFWTSYGQDNIPIPAGARSVTYAMFFNRFEGDDNDGYVDDNYLNIDYTRNVYWKSAVNGNWSDNSKWSAVQPASSEDVVFNKSGTYTVNLNTFGASRHLSVLNGNVTVNANGASRSTDVYGNLSVGVSSGVAASLKIAGNAGLYLRGSGAHDIGKNAGSTGTLTIDGAGTMLSDSTGWLGIGNAGTGRLNVSNGGVANITSGYVGYGNGGVGTLDVGGAGSAYNGTSLTLGGNSAKTTIGRGTVNLHDDGAIGLTGTLNVYNTTGTAFNFSGGTLSVANLNLDGNRGRFNWSAGTLTLTGGHIAQLGGATFVVPALGTLNGSGTVDGDVQNDGIITSEMTTGGLHVAGDFGQSGGAELDFVLGGTGRGTYFHPVLIDGAMVADGTLRVVLAALFNPSLGDTFDLLDFTSFNGGFTCDLPELAPGLTWDVTQLSTDGTLTVVAVPEPGTVAGVGLLSALLMLLRRRRHDRAA